MEKILVFDINQYLILFCHRFKQSKLTGVNDQLETNQGDNLEQVGIIKWAYFENEENPILRGKFCWLINHSKFYFS